MFHRSKIKATAISFDEREGVNQMRASDLIPESYTLQSVSNEKSKCLMCRL